MPRDDATLLDIVKAARLVVEFKGKLSSVIPKHNLQFCINYS